LVKNRTELKINLFLSGFSDWNFANLNFNKNTELTRDGLKSYYFVRNPEEKYKKDNKETEQVGKERNRE